MKYEFDPIGFIRSDARYPQEAPRQGTLTRRKGELRLCPNRNFETALADLEGVERIWIIFVFDRVSSWKPKVRPPLGGTDQKIGVFATRSPHRPNPIGITAARLTGIRGLILDVEEIDLLDGTPVLDIKPYIPLADSFPDAKTGWRDAVQSALFPVELTAPAAEKAQFLLEHGGPDLEEFCRVQLGTRDLDPKRLRLTGPDAQGIYILAFRTWRITFRRLDDKCVVQDVFSGYSDQELSPENSDRYGDKKLHRTFRQRFG